MIGRLLFNPAAVGANRRALAGRPRAAPGVILLPALLQPNPFGPAVDAAGRAFHSAYFWAVLASLLGAGCIYYLVRWLYERRLLQQQENLQRLYTLSEIILESPDPNMVQKEVAEVARLVAAGTHCYVLILNSAAQQLEYAAGTDSPPLAAVSLSAISGAVTCFRSQALTEVPDAENCPFVKTEIVRRLGQKALLYVPITLGGTCLGVIEVEDRTRKRIFSRQEKTRVRHVARLAALGLRLGDQRTVQTHLHRTAKMSAVSDLIEAVAETLVTPLRRLGELASGPSDDHPAEAVARLKEVARESRRAVATVERLANLARSRRGHPQEVDVHQLLEGVRERWIEDGRSLQLSLSRAPARVTADPDHLEQVLLNLLQHGEQLLEGVGARELQVSTNLLERNLLISIGPPGEAERGEPEPHVADDERLLEPESSLRLAVCRNLIEGFGGTLRVENRAKRGFRIELGYPLAADTLRRKQPAAPRHGAGGVSAEVLTALVIDPDTAIQDALLYLLSERGYRVIPVSTAEEGLDLCQQAHFDCVFCDARPSGGGLEVYGRIRSGASRFIFLAETALAVENGDFPGKDCAVLHKPVDESELDRVLESVPPEPAETVENTEKQPASAG
jgi:signal transduction histidine kinase/ActR/RegA family two-component response regulator